MASDDGAAGGDRAAAAVARHRREGWRAVRRTRSKATSRTCRGSTSPTAPASSCIRRRGTSACKRLPYFIEQKDGVKTELVAVGLDGAPVAGVPVDVKLTQIQWNSVRRAEGNGFYTWDTERKEVPVGRVARSRRGASRCRSTIPLPAGGYFVLEARARRRTQGRFTVTRDVVLRARRRLHRVGSATTTTASTSCPSARPTSPATRRAS